MKTRAAVAFKAKKPLEIVELDLEGVAPSQLPQIAPNIGRFDGANLGFNK